MTDYLLQPAEQEPQDDEKEEAAPDNEKGKKGESKARSQRSNLVIFAVDISGSMSTTVEVPALQAEWSSVTGRGGGGGGPRYISRLEAIKEAVCRHLDHMSITEPRNKVSRACEHTSMIPVMKHIMMLRTRAMNMCVEMPHHKLSGIYNVVCHYIIYCLFAIGCPGCV